MRWELAHLFGKNYERKTLFLLPPRLAPPAEAARVLPAALTHWKKPGDWGGHISEIARNEQRFCIGWFWRDDGQVEVFTSQHDSYLAYLLAVRTYLSRSADRFDPPPVTRADAGQAPVLRPKVYVGSGIMIAIASIVYLVLTLSAPNGAPFFVTPVYAIIASWALSRAGLPFALVPVLGISLAQGMLELTPVVTFLITGQSAEQILPVFVDLLVLLGLVAWTIRARSRRTVIALMIYHLLTLLVPVFFILSGTITVAAFALPIVMEICAVTAAVFAVAKLGRANRA